MRWFKNYGFLIASLAIPILPTCSADVIRRGNLDYFDGETLQYYLKYNAEDKEDAANYDVAIMFYAQWCRNCHSLAPLWNQIAEILQAGTSESKLIVGLFDCEADMEHAAYCTEAGVTHYPTLKYFSLAPGHKFHGVGKSGGPAHSTHFKGNWQYGDAILDWIKTMSFLSRWHRSGWGQRLRNLVFRGKNYGSSGSSGSKALPVGVPDAVSSEHELEKLRTIHKETEAMSIRSGVFVETLLFPPTLPGLVDSEGNEALKSTSVPGKTYTDMFGYMNVTDGWKLDENPFATEQARIVKQCIGELSLDYCTRISSSFMHEWIAANPLKLDLTQEDYLQFETEMNEAVGKQEPYCTTIEYCILVDFTEEECTPPTCPFVDEIACRYLTACLTEALQDEYAAAMQQEKVDQFDAKPPKEKSDSGFSWGLK